MKKTILLTACLTLTLGGCATDSKPAPATAAKPAAATVAASPELDQTIANAEKEIAAAKKVGIWRDTETFLEDAKKAKAAGKNDDALKLAKKALKQAQLAQQQAASQANVKAVYPN
jgi:hypothetical protein